MNCYCCGKMLRAGDENGWHPACIKRFFGTTVIPKIELDEASLERTVNENTNSRISVPGVQKKLSLSLYSDGRTTRLTLVNYPARYILKPQVDEFECMPEAEQLVMSMAEMTGISTVPHALIRNGEKIAYISKRVDRVFDKSGAQKLAMEDFCQLDLRLTQDKYRGSYERCAKVIERYSSRPMLDMTELFMRLVFSFVVGNSDMHLKNFSLIETEEASNQYVLAPAYDLLPVNVIMPEDPEEFALTMNGKKTNLRKKDFYIFAQTCGINEASARKMIAKIVSMKTRYMELCEESLMSQDGKTRLRSLIEERLQRL